jgi:hypothetical protein
MVQSNLVKPESLIKEGSLTIVSIYWFHISLLIVISDAQLQHVRKFRNLLLEQLTSKVN